MDASASWALGLFEGEGSITSFDNKGRIYLQLSVETTDRDILERFHFVVGRGHIHPKGRHRQGLGKKTMFRWQAATREDVLLLLNAWMPLLSERRYAQAERALIRFEAQRPKQVAHAT